MKRCTKVDRKAPTSVFWDIDKCPVPSGFDAHQVFPCIKRFLKNEGYSGPLSITAVGKLTNVPRDFLRALSSTGIHLRHTESRNRSVVGLLFAWSVHVDLPANVMVISTKKRDYPGFGILSGYGLNLIYDFPHTTFKVPGPLEEEDKCSDTGGWKCTLCYDLTGLGAESLIKHFSSREHKQLLRECFPYRGCSIRCLEAPPPDSATLVEATTPLDSTTLVEAPTLDSTMVKKQPKAKKKNSGKRKEQMEEQKGREKRKKMEEQEDEGRGKKRKQMEEQEEEGRGKRLKIEEQKGRVRRWRSKREKGRVLKKNSEKYKKLRT